ncbi:MAG: hypothetical protein DRN26_01355 [Thermoplasmata archaeon]|nr:MAG: hypothetical protein DRN26_01355 [Thermoplasmata archaeon]
MGVSPGILVILPHPPPARDVGAGWSPETSEYNIWMRGSRPTPSGEKANASQALVSVSLSGRFFAHDRQTPRRPYALVQGGY